MQNREQQSDPPSPPDWMKPDSRDACYRLCRDPELSEDTLAMRSDVPPSAGEDVGSNSTVDTREPSRHLGWRTIIDRDLPLETETVVYIFVSALDLFVTWMMLRSGHFHERNPVARYFLDYWGPKGMIYYKFSVVAIVTLAAQGIALKKPATARFVLILGSVVSVAVVVYSITLFLRGTPA